MNYRKMDFRQIIETTEYDFLRTHPRLGNRIILLGISGSYGYGTSREGSDIDFRGVTLNLPSDLLGLTRFDQYEDDKTDTVIFSFNKLVGLLLNCNPNTIELLGLDEDQYVIKNELGQELLDHRELFLSKRAAASFGHYAGAQLRRLQNAIARDTLSQPSREQHILRSVKHAMHLIRLFMMGIDILEKSEIRTHRPESDLSLLCSIRNGDYMKDGILNESFYEIVADYENRFANAERNSSLPDNPDMEAVGQFVESANRRAIMEDLS